MADANHWEALRKQRLLDRKRECKNAKEGLYRYRNTTKDIYNAQRAGPCLGTVNVYPEADSHHRAKLKTPHLDKRLKEIDYFQQW